MNNFKKSEVVFNLPAIILVIIAFAIIVYFFIGKYFSNKDNLITLQKKGLNAKVVFIEDIGRGGVFIKSINNNAKVDSFVITLDIPVSAVNLNDSIAKFSNSNSIEFYKLIKGKYKLYYNHVIFNPSE